MHKKIIGVFIVIMTVSQVASADVLDSKYSVFGKALTNHSLIATDQWGLDVCGYKYGEVGDRYPINCGVIYVDGRSAISRDTFEIHDRAACSVNLRAEPDIHSVSGAAARFFEAEYIVMRLQGIDESSALHFTEKHEVYEDNGKKYTHYQLNGGRWAGRTLLIDCTKKIGDQRPFTLSMFQGLLTPMFKIEMNPPELQVP